MPLVENIRAPDEQDQLSAQGTATLKVCGCKMMQGFDALRKLFGIGFAKALNAVQRALSPRSMVKRLGTNF